MAEVALSIRELAKRYGSVEAVRGISLDVAPGEIFGLIGPNGAGTVSYTHLDVYKRQGSTAGRPL